MTNLRQLRNLIFNLSLGAATAALAIAFVLILIAPQPAQAQYTFKVIHNFSGGQDGATPEAGVTLDQAGNLYGTAWVGGIGDGTAYKLKPSGSGWIFDPLHSFTGSFYGDGANPRARVIFGPNSTLYGTTANGGAGVGTVFNLRPPPTAPRTALAPWNESVLYSFVGSPTDGANPGRGDLIFDPAGDIYGTTYSGGNDSIGVVYELMPSGSGYTETVLYSFSGNDGANPANGVILDSALNLYGTTYVGGLDTAGVVFELMPSGGGGWTDCTLWNFRNGSDGRYPIAGLIFGQSGNANLYGATSDGGTGHGGTVFQLTYSAPCTWTLKTLYSFTGAANCGPYGTLYMDASGNLYGTTYCDGAKNAGNVWELTPSNGSWIYTSLYDFTGGNDGGNPVSNVVMDGSGNLYGTASTGGTQTVGVVWELVKQ